MNQLSLRVAIVALCAMTVSVAVCRAQVDDTAGATNTSSTASGQDASSSEAEQPIAAAPAGASSWTAGSASFKPSNDASWGGKKESFGTVEAKSWTAESNNFAEHVQAGGIWRENPPSAPAAKPVSAESVYSSRPLARPGPAHAVSRRAHPAGAGTSHGTSRSGVGGHAAGSARHTSTRSIVSSGSERGSGMSTIPDTIQAPSMSAPALSSTLNDQLGSPDK